MRQVWEYKVIETKDRAALQPELANFGAEGWELVSATAMFNTLMTKVVYTLFLKRPVPADDVRPLTRASRPLRRARPASRCAGKRRC